MSSRKTPVYLSVAAKCDAIRMKDSGEPVDAIVDKYGIARSTFYKMYKRRDNMEQEFATGTQGFSTSTKVIRLEDSADVDKIVLHWYLRCKEKGVLMSGGDIRRKALEINEKLNGHPGFKASTTWLQAFKKRYHISSGKSVAIESNLKAVEAFIAKFNRLREEGGIPLKNIYNVVYTSMMWRAVPKNTVVFDRAKKTGNLKMCEQYVTALLCANATGCHKLPVLIIGRDPEIQKLYNFETEIFSTIYKSKSNVSMDRTFFTYWYKEHFLKSIKIRQEEEKGRQMCLLLLNNATLLHDVKYLSDIDPFVVVLSSPLEVPNFKLPMNCGIVASFIRNYRKEFLETIKPLPNYNRKNEVLYLYDKLNMWDCCRIVHTAWKDVNNAILIHSWDSLLLRKLPDKRIFEVQLKVDIFSALESLEQIPGSQMCNKDFVLRWFNIDNEHDIVDKICTEEVLEEFGNNSLGQPMDIDIIDDQAGPSHS